MNTQLWATALNDLKHQMTRATFDTWLQHTRLKDASNGTWQVATPNPFALEWLDGRLYNTIQRTVTNIAGHPVELVFVVEEPEPYQPEPGQFDRAALARVISQDQIAAFDVYEAGYSPHAHYIQQFWGAYFGADVMQIWNYVRSFYYEPRYTYDRSEKAYIQNPEWSAWTPARQFRPSDLARAIKSKNKKDPYRRAITGGWKSCHLFKAAYDQGDTWTVCHHCSGHDGQLTEAKPSDAYPEGRPTCRWWKPGILEQLEAEGVCQYHQTGDPDKARTIFYQISIFQDLPILTPAQIATLNEETQREHELWLKRHQIDLPAWRAITDRSQVPARAEKHG